MDKLDPELFAALLDVNVKAVYHTCRAVWPVFSAQRGGVVVTGQTVFIKK